MHEVKFDGYRLQAVLEKRQAVIRTRLVSIGPKSSLPWQKPSPDCRSKVRSSTAKRSLKIARGSLISRRFRSPQSGRNDTIIFYAFHFLYLTSHDLKALPLLQRKEILEQVFSAAPPGGPLRYSAHFASGGEELLHHLCRLGGEGIVSKHTGKPYRSGRNGDWLKSKCANRQEFVVIGYVPSTSTPKAIGSLVLGYHEKGKLLHAGRAGTGYNSQTARDFFAGLEKIRIDEPAAEGPLPVEAKRDVRWVAPSLVAEVEFRGWTAAKLLRQAAFKALREDKAASEVVRETAVPDREPRETATKANARLTHPDRVLWPRAGFTKQALADYYTSIWDLIAPNITGRPLALLRCPAGVDRGCFFQRYHRQVPPHIFR